MSAWLHALLSPLGADALAAPGWLLVLAPLAAAAVLLALRRAPPSLPWPGLGEARRAGGRWIDPVRALALVARLGTLLLLAVAIAGPVAVQRGARSRRDGLDMVLVLDLSGSMRAVDAEVRGEPRTRLDLALEVVTRFVLHRVSEGDRVGLVVFGGKAYTQSPLTSDGRLLAAALERIEPGAPNEPTALGEGLALAVRRVTAGTDPDDSLEGPQKGRVVVLLTDGRSNAGNVPIDVAASIAAAKRIRVHTVGIGAERHRALDRAGAAAGGASLTDLDAETLRRVAALCDGRFFHARRSDDLDAVYAEIDALERVARPAPEPLRKRPRTEPFLALAGALLLAEAVFARGLLRRIP